MTTKLRVMTVLPFGACVTLILAVACGGGDDNSGDASPTATSTASIAPASGPGTITVGSSPIAGQAGRVLLIFATAQGGGGSLARACQQITSDDYSVAETVLTDVPSGSDPCGGSTSPTELPEGAYVVTVGIYAPPAQTAEAETTLTVQVKGNVSAMIDGSALSR